MNREELIERLRALEESLPSQLMETENARKIMSASRMHFQRSLDKMEDADLKEGIYDELAVERENDRRDTLTEELRDLKLNIARTEGYHDTLEREISILDERVSSFPSQIERYEEIISGYDIQSNNTISNEEREYITAKREKRLKELEQIREERETLVKELNNRREKLSQISEALEQKRTQTEEFAEQVRKIDSNIEEIKRNGSMSLEERQKLELDTEALYRMSRFFSANPKKEINNIIYDFENGRLSEEQVNERLQNMKALLTTGIYNIDGLKAKLSHEQILEKRRETEEAIQALEEKIDDDAYYMEKTSEYDEALDNIVGYKEIIRYIRNNQIRLDAERSNDNQEILENEEKINKYNKWINDEERTIELINTLPVSDLEKARRIGNVNLRIESYKASREILVNKSKRIKSKTEDYDRDKYIADLRIKKYEDKIEKERTRLYYLNEDERKKDREELEKLEAVLLSTHLTNSVFENDYVKELDGLIDLTGGKHLESDGKAIPSFVAGFTQEQRKIYDDLVAGLSAEDKREIEAEATKKVEKAILENPQKSVTTNEESTQKTIPPLLPIPDGRKHKVEKFKTLTKEKTDEAKEWFKKNWKKVTTIAGAVLLAGALAFSCNSSKTNNKTNTNDPVSVVVEMPVKEDPIPYPIEELPEVTPPEFEQETQKPPKNPSTPSPTPIDPITPEIPTPDIIPEPTMTGHYYLDTELTTGTGNSAPADPNEAHLVGESVYNPITNTWVDSQGTKITQTDTGAFIVEPESEEVTPVDENTNMLENPDMSPLEEEQVPEEAQSLEEAVEEGTLSAEEAQEYQDYFDTLFGEIDEGNSVNQGRGK